VVFVVLERISHGYSDGLKPVAYTDLKTVFGVFVIFVIVVAAAVGASQSLIFPVAAR
jgi:hypothetical protein